MTHEEMVKAIEDLRTIITHQRAEIKQLNIRLGRLKEWSDLNDYYIEEAVNALTHSVDKLMGLEDDERDYEYTYERTVKEAIESSQK